MKQETIGSKGTVPGFRPLIGKERWHRSDFTAEMLSGEYRPLLLNEPYVSGDEYRRKELGGWGVETYSGLRRTLKSDGFRRTKRPLPPPAVETFEAHGHIWYKHTPGDECPVEPDAVVAILFRDGTPSNARASKAKSWFWHEEGDEVDIIGYRFQDYPAVHTTLQQEQQSAQQPIETIPTQFSTEQRLTSLYNDWCFLPPETVAECIADVASVLYPTDAERCEAAFQRWKLEEYGESSVLEWTAKVAWTAAWKAAKESK